MSWRSAITVDNRSSQYETGKSMTSFIFSTNSSVFSARSPFVPFIFFGIPTTSSCTSYSAMSSCKRLKSFSRDVLRMVSIPCAVMSSASLQAMPIVRLPTSNDIILIIVVLPLRILSTIPQSSHPVLNGGYQNAHYYSL